MLLAPLRRRVMLLFWMAHIDRCRTERENMVPTVWPALAKACDIDTVGIATDSCRCSRPRPPSTLHTTHQTPNAIMYSSCVCDPVQERHFPSEVHSALRLLHDVMLIVRYPIESERQSTPFDVYVCARAPRGHAEEGRRLKANWTFLFQLSCGHCPGL